MVALFDPFIFLVLITLLFNFLIFIYFSYTFLYCNLIRPWFVDEGDVSFARADLPSGLFSFSRSCYMPGVLLPTPASLTLGGGRGRRHCTSTSRIPCWTCGSFLGAVTPMCVVAMLLGPLVAVGQALAVWPALPLPPLSCCTV